MQKNDTEVLWGDASSAKESHITKVLLEHYDDKVEELDKIRFPSKHPELDIAMKKFDEPE
jgi:hypothetical protein